MRNKIIGFGIGFGVLLSSVTPVFAQESIGATLGAATKACNQTAKAENTRLRESAKNDTSLSKTELKLLLKAVETTRVACIKDAKAVAKTAMDKKRTEDKAKLEAKRAEAKAKIEAKKAEMKEKAEARKAELKAKKDARKKTN